MSTVSSTSALPPAVADDASCAASSETCFGSDHGHRSDTDDDLASGLRSDTDDATAPTPTWPAGPIGPPFWIGPPPGLELEAVAPPAGRAPLRGRAAEYSPLRVQAEEPVPECLALESTTVMMRNVPCTYTVDSLIDLLESKGFSKRFDFVYVPVKRTEMLGVGYSFVNLISREAAESFILAFEGFDGWASPFPEKPCTMSWSACQGLEENIARYRNSPLMRDDVRGVYKPVLLKAGVRIPFPRPTRILRSRKVKDGDCADRTAPLPPPQRRLQRRGARGLPS